METHNFKHYILSYKQEAGIWKRIGRKEENIKHTMQHYIFIACIIVFWLSCISASAQYTTDNSLKRRAIVVYEKDTDGYYKKIEDRQIDSVSNLEKIYAFDEKTSNLYVMTYNGNYEITLTKKYAKNYRNNKYIPQLQDNELLDAINRVNIDLENHFMQLNEQHRKIVTDSISKIRQLEALKAKAEKEKASYKYAHDWMWLPTGITLNCIDPGSEDFTACKNTTKEDSVLCLGIKNDTIYYVTSTNYALDVNYSLIHCAKISSQLKNRERYKLHWEVYRDSLIKNNQLSLDFIHRYNLYSVSEAIDKIRERTPYGYISDWGWNDKYSWVSFYFTFHNMSRKTIKYIDVYWTIKNAVGDVRKTGCFSGTGPVESLSSGSWNWDSSSYFVAGDATNMNITKLIITYMDGAKKILVGNAIKFD